MTKIMKNNGQLTVPDKVTIPYIEGDGVEIGRAHV